MFFPFPNQKNSTKPLNSDSSNVVTPESVQNVEPATNNIVLSSNLSSNAVVDSGMNGNGSVPSKLDIINPSSTLSPSLSTSPILNAILNSTAITNLDSNENRV